MKITQPQISFEYAYDNAGNITSEKRSSKYTTYQYDALGQLIRVNDQNDTTIGTTGTTWTYSYDKGGNILSKSRYAYTAAGTNVGTAHRTLYGPVSRISSFPFRPPRR